MNDVKVSLLRNISIHARNKEKKTSNQKVDTNQSKKKVHSSKESGGTGQEDDMDGKEFIEGGGSGATHEKVIKDAFDHEGGAGTGQEEEMEGKASNS